MEYIAIGLALLGFSYGRALWRSIKRDVKEGSPTAEALQKTEEAVAALDRLTND